MFPPEHLSSNDSCVLEQIFDPENIPNPKGLQVHIIAHDDYNTRVGATLAALKNEERSLVRRIEAILSTPHGQARNQEFDSVSIELDNLIENNPHDASLRNNRAQLLRVRYGDRIIFSNHKLEHVAETIFADLNTAIRLVSPTTIMGAISPVQQKTMVQAHMQRGALFLGLSKLLKSQEAAGQLHPVNLASPRNWDVNFLETACSKDFFMAGKYGNAVGKTLSVYNNPTAKLCGQIVQEAMKIEYNGTM